MLPVADDDGRGRYLTAAQTTRLAEAMKIRRKELGAAVHHLWPLSRNTHLWPLSRNTLSLWSQGDTRAQLGTLPTVDQVMWWEEGSASDYARDLGPIRRRPKPTPLQWAIFDARCKGKLGYGDVAVGAGDSPNGTPRLTHAQVEQLERQPLYEPPTDAVIAALARGLGVDEDQLHRYAAASVQPVGDAAVDQAAKNLLNQVHHKAHGDRRAALAAASLVVESDEMRELVELLDRLPGQVQPAAIGAVREVLSDAALRRLIGRLAAVPDGDRPELLDAFAAIVRVLGRTPGREAAVIDYISEGEAITLGVDDERMVEEFRPGGEMAGAEQLSEEGGGRS